jgi:hypothetical protein
MVASVIYLFEDVLLEICPSHNIVVPSKNELSLKKRDYRFDNGNILAGNS